MPEPGQPPVLDAQHWGVHYPESSRPALHDLTVQAQPGECILLAGPSGSGKSTLAASLIGLVPHSTYAHITGNLHAGHFNARLHGPGEMAQRIGLVFQDPDSQLTMLTVVEEIAFGLENLGIHPADMPQRIEQALIDTGFNGLAQTPVDQLSGGMKQRLVIAAVLAMQPDILVLDEPTAQLDPQGVLTVVDLLRRLRAQRPQQTMIIIEHRLDALVALIDRVWLLDQNGCLVCDAPTEQAFGPLARTFTTHNAWLPTDAEARLVRASGGLLAWSAPASSPPGSPHREPVLAVSNLQFGHPGTARCLIDINLELFPGEILALVGANGSGKSTLAQLCAGLLAPTAGKVTLNHRPVRAFTAAELAARLGYVFQNPEHQFVTDRVIDEVRYLPTNAPNRGSGEEWAVLKSLRLDHLAERNPFTLSHGQKRRLSAATVLLHQRDVLIMDEPTFGQDPAALRELRRLLSSLAEQGTAVILITHDMNLVWRTAHRVVALHAGQLTGNQAPTCFFSDPRHLNTLGLEAPALARWWRDAAAAKAVS